MHGSAAVKQGNVCGRLGFLQSTFVKCAICTVEQFGIANGKICNIRSRRKTAQHGQFASCFIDPSKERRVVRALLSKTVQFGFCGTDRFECFFLAHYMRIISIRICFIYEYILAFFRSCLSWSKIVYMFTVIGNKPPIRVVQLSEIIVGIS